MHRSADAANYLRGDERLDLLYASRPVTRHLLATAQPRTTTFGALNVISLEGLIAFKLQGLINDPRRTRDLEDIRAPTQPMRDPFEALDDLMLVVEALCPTWPPRESFAPMPDVRL